MLKLPLTSALIYRPEELLNKPRLIREPLYSSCLHISSKSRKLHLSCSLKVGKSNSMLETPNVNYQNKENLK